MLSVFLTFDVVGLHAVPVDHHLKASRANFNRLSEDDPLGHSSQHIDLREHSSSEEYISCFLETSLPEYRDIADPVDAVAVDGSEDATSTHPVCEY